MFCFLYLKEEFSLLQFDLAVLMKCHNSSHQQAVLSVSQVPCQLSGHHGLASAMHKKLGLLYKTVHLQHLAKATRAENDCLILYLALQYICIGYATSFKALTIITEKPEFVTTKS